ncbi:MAG TPA: hypothetical protein VFZ48_03620 [Candidatus Saccharimonadales bacterium]
MATYICPSSSAEPPSSGMSRDGRPQWKIHWDEVLSVAAEELALIKDSGRTIKWPAQGFFDILVTTPKSRGVYRVFRVCQDGTVKLGTKPRNGLVTMIQPNQVELHSHVTGFKSELKRKLALMCR